MEGVLIMWVAKLSVEINGVCKPVRSVGQAVFQVQVQNGDRVESDGILGYLVVENMRNTKIPIYKDTRANDIERELWI